MDKIIRVIRYELALASCMEVGKAVAGLRRSSPLVARFAPVTAVQLSS